MKFDLENEYTAKGYAVIAGTDEAGRGPLCGPVCAAAVILDPNAEIPGLNDSKKLTEKKREQLYALIVENAVSYGIAYADVEEIDELNILNASQLAMRRAVAMLTPCPDLVLVDGNVARGFPMDTVKVIKGDSISPSIAAASILAKVSRDRLCMELDKAYPMYGISAHKGYPTKAHMDAVRKYGPAPIHRKTFLKFLSKDEHH
ncbi:MAG: ribonuclease HII [Ruminococcaceae bacterium]|nr:ribonuclease HII [Oscillospiraceae bacterium]